MPLADFDWGFIWANRTLFQHALVRTPQPIEWDEAALPKPVVTGDDEATGLVAH